MRIDYRKLGRLFERVKILTIFLLACVVLIYSFMGIVTSETVQQAEIDSTQFYFGIGSGESMEPRIEECDLLLYQDKQYSELDQGDIIAYEHPARDEVIVHKYLGDGRAKGINNEYADSTEVTENNYRKTVFSVIETSSLCG